MGLKTCTFFKFEKVLKKLLNEQKECMIHFGM